MRSKFAVLLAVAVVCVTTASADWTSENLVTGSSDVWRMFVTNGHKVVFGTDGVGHLVWQGGPRSEGLPGIWYNRYNPGSGSKPGSWTADFAVAPYSTKKKVTHSSPCVALDGDGRTIHVVWSSRPPVPFWPDKKPDTVCYRNCTQDRRGNAKWGAVVPLYAANYPGGPVVACVSGEPSHVFACWRNLVPIEAGGHSMVTRLREYVNGAWTDVVRLDSSYMGPRTEGPSIAAAPNGDVFVAYDGYEEGTTGPQIFVKTRTDGVWGEPVNVTKISSSLRCWPFAIEVNPTTNNPHVVFTGRTEVPNGGGLDTVQAVYHTYRNSSGAWLTTPEAISEPRYWWLGVGCARMAFDSDGVAHAVWDDTIPPTSGGIMYRYCLSEGETWSAPEWLTSYRASGPFITVEEPAHTIRVVWERHLDDPYRDEIWWKSNYLGGGEGQAQPMALPQPGVELFPNPAKAGRVTVQYALPHAGPMAVTLLDVSGRAVEIRELAADKSGSVTIDVSGLNAGVYVLKLDVGATSQTRKLVIQ